jgi:hypothetical protein
MQVHRIRSKGTEESEKGEKACAKLLKSKRKIKQDTLRILDYRSQKNKEVKNPTHANRFH